MNPDPSPFDPPGSTVARPTPSRLRSFVLRLLSVVCWTVGLLCVVAVGLSAYSMVLLVNEQGWVRVSKLVKPGEWAYFCLMPVLTASFGLAGRSFWLDRIRRGFLWVLVAGSLVSAIGIVLNTH